MNKFKTAEEIWDKFQEGVKYKTSINLYETVDENEEFFVSRQWGELVKTAPDMDKPVVNFLQRVVSYFVSNVTTDTIGVRCRFFNMLKDKAKFLESVIKAQLEQSIEYNDLNNESKDAVRDAAVDGDACHHIYFDPNAESGQLAAGLVKIERIQNTDVYFGNRQEPDVEKQPYIIIATRKQLEDAQELAERMGGKKEEIQPDSGEYDTELQQKDTAKRVTMLTCYYKKNGTVHRVISCQSAIISKETDLGYKLYPISWFPWERQRGSYHGVSCVTALIPNQIVVNKIYALSAKYQRDFSFRKYVYDQTMFPNGWSNKMGAIAVNGDPRMAAIDLTPATDLPNSVFTMIDSLMSNSREMMGASDASLGNVNPDNTSAIIAVQNATAMPLEMKKRGYQQMVEKDIRSALDIMTVHYGVRDVLITDELGRESIVPFDFASLKDELFKLSVDVGDANYWDPNTQASMIERLWTAGVITDPVMFLDHMPDGLLKDKERLKAELKEAQKNAMSQMPVGDAALAAGGEAGSLPMPQMPTGI